MRKSRLMTPGPTPVLPEAAAVLGSPQPHHRTAEFKAVVARCRERLREVFRCGDDGEPLLLTASGTGAMEAALVSLTRPGERVLVVDSGKFGGRWALLATAFGRPPVVLKPPRERAVTPGELGAALESAPDVSGVFLAACETSTAVRADVAGLAAVVREQRGDDALVVVDAITELGAGRLEAAGWDLDVVIGGSQKAFMIPPGLAFLSLSPRAQRRLEQAGGGGFYLDLARELAAQRRDTTSWTPATGLVAALDAALGRMLADGMEAIWSATERRARMARAAFPAMGLELFAADPAVSVTAVKAPAGVDGGRIVAAVEERFGVRLAGGQDELKGRIFRLAHLGWIDEVDTLGTLGAVGVALASLGARVDTAAGLAAAVSVMAEAEPAPGGGGS